MALRIQLLCVFVLVNIVSCHYYWFDMPSPQKLNDGAESLYEDEPLQQMQKRFRVKYIRELSRLPALDNNKLPKFGTLSLPAHYHKLTRSPPQKDHSLQPIRLWASPTSPQDQLINLYNVLRRVVN